MHCTVHGSHQLGLAAAVKPVRDVRVSAKKKGKAGRFADKKDRDLSAIFGPEEVKEDEPVSASMYLRFGELMGDNAEQTLSSIQDPARRKKLRVDAESLQYLEELENRTKSELEYTTFATSRSSMLSDEDDVRFRLCPVATCFSAILTPLHDPTGHGLTRVAPKCTYQYASPSRSRSCWPSHAARVLGHRPHSSDRIRFPVRLHIVQAAGSSLGTGFGPASAIMR